MKIMSIYKKGSYSKAKNTKLFIKVLLLIFICEAVIMGLLHFSPTEGPWHIILDPILLAILITPLLYLYAVRPLRKSEEQLKEAQHIGHIGSWEWNIQTGDLKWSEETFHMYGLEPQEPTPTFEKFTELVYPEDLKFVQEEINAALQNNKNYNVDFRIIRSDGAIAWVHCKGRITHDKKGNPLIFFGTQADITDRKRAEERLLGYQKKLQAVASELILAEENQQKKIAGELHDGVCQLLVFCKMSLGKLKGSLEDQAVVSHVNEISDTINLAINKSRTLTFDLANPILFELGLCQAIDDLAHSYLQEKYNITAHVQCEDAKCKDLSPRLTDDLRVVIYRAVRELFVNIVKHADASAVDVALLLKDDNLRIEVTDDGDGFDYVAEARNRKSGKKIGLFIIMERLHCFGGHLDFEFGREKGTKAIIEIPLP